MADKVAPTPNLPVPTNTATGAGLNGFLTQLIKSITALFQQDANTINNLVDEVTTLQTDVADATAQFTAIGMLPYGGARNFIGRNGGLEIWQRGTSIAVAASTVAYTADGWYLSTGANQAYTVARVGTPTTMNFGRSHIAARVQRNSGQTGTGAVVFAFPLDEEEIQGVRGNKLILSAQFLAGANWSPSSGTLTYNVYLGTGAVAKRNGSSYTNEQNPITGTINVTAGGAASLVSAISSAISGAITQGEVQFKWTPSGTAGADDWINIDDVQLEAVPDGLTSFTPVFERTNFAYDLLRSKRHFTTSFPYLTTPAQNIGPAGCIVGVAATTGAGSVSYRIWWPTEMRTTPSITTFNTNAADSNWWDVNGGASRTAVTAEVNSSSMRIVMNAASSAGSQHFIHYTANASI